MAQKRNICFFLSKYLFEPQYLQSLEWFYMDDLVESGHSGPALVWANWYRFHPTETITHSQVGSVCFLWVIRGSGHITSGSTRFAMTSSTVLVLPFRHDVTYEPDPDKPFHLGTIHLVPRHAHHRDIDIGVGVAPGDMWNAMPWRAGGTFPSSASHATSAHPAARALITLGTYGVECFLAGRTDQSTLRSLGTLMVDEIHRLIAHHPHPHTPARLQAMMDHVTQNLEAKHSVATLSHIGDCSPATAERLFRHHTGLAMMTWVRHHRLREAALLLRTTGMTIGEVGRGVGYPDQLHFSRVFRQHFGMPPSRFAADIQGP